MRNKHEVAEGVCFEISDKYYFDISSKRWFSYETKSRIHTPLVFWEVHEYIVRTESPAIRGVNASMHTHAFMKSVENECKRILAR